MVSLLAITVVFYNLQTFGSTKTTFSLDWRSSKSDRWSTYFQWNCNAPDVVNPGIVLLTENEESKESQLLLFGGGFRSSTNASDLTYTYNIDMRRWSLVKTVRSPQARVNPIIVRFCNNILLFGGYRYTRMSGNLTQDPYRFEDLWMYMYNREKKSWNPVTAKTTLRHPPISVSDSRVVSTRWNTSCQCNDAAILLAGENWSSFWRLQCSRDNDNRRIYEWVTLHSKSEVSPSCGLLSTLASTTSSHHIYAMDRESQLWRLHLLTNEWTRLVTFRSRSIAEFKIHAMFLEPRNEYVLFSEYWREAVVYSVNESSFKTEPCEGSWMAGNYFDSYPSPHMIFVDGFPLIYIDATPQCWPHFWRFRKQDGIWKWINLGEPLLAPTVSQSHDRSYRILGNEAGIQSFTQIDDHVYVFVKRLNDHWISERQPGITVFGPQVWSIDLSTMTWWSYDVARNITDDLINRRWCGSLWLNNTLVVSTFHRCSPAVQMWSYDLTVREWRRLENDMGDGVELQASCGHSLVAINSTTGILFGGKSVCRKDQMLCDVWQFKIHPLVSQVQWSIPNSKRAICNDTLSPRGTYGHSAVRVADEMLVYGGFEENMEACRNELWSYNILVTSWQKLEGTSSCPKLSPTRLCSSSAAATTYALWLTILCDSQVASRCSNAGFQTWMYLMTLKTWIVLSESYLYESQVLSNMAFLDRNTLAMFDPYHASLLTVKAGCPNGFASPDITSTPCHVCEAGTYAEAGELYCKVCPRGLTTPGNRSDTIQNCSLCNKGFCRNGDCLVAQANGVPGATCLCNIGYSGDRCGSPIYILIGVLILVIIVALSIAIFKGFAVWKDKTRTERSLQEELSRMSSAWEIQRHEVKVGQRLGSGAFGDVFEAEYRGITVAVKVLREWEDSRSSHEFQREILFMQTIRHPNIVLFIGCGSSEGTREPFLVLEYMSRGTLRDLLYNTEDVYLSDDKKLDFASDAARGMRFLHGLNPPRIHRDLKSANVLVSDDWVVKVSDFGLGRTVTSSRQRTRQGETGRRPKGGRRMFRSKHTTLLNPESDLSLSNIGTARWCAPELLAGQEYDSSIDVFR